MKTKYNLSIFKKGDLFICQSVNPVSRWGMVIMASNTLWNYIISKLNRTYKPVRFYHSGIIVNNTQVIEQYFKVRYNTIEHILNRKAIIFRMKKLTKKQQKLIIRRAKRDIGKPYNVPLSLAYIFSWITGINKTIEEVGNLTKNQEVCTTELAKCYKNICNFGIKNYKLLTTKDIEKYCLKNKNWEIVYRND